MSAPRPQTAAPRGPETDRAGRRARLALHPEWVAGFFLWTSGIHVGIVAADPGFYRHFADNALVPGLSNGWGSWFVPHAVAGGLLVAAGELGLALLLLGSRPWRRAGWVGVIAFHVALLAFGWGFWAWSVPALVVLLRAAAADLSGEAVALGHLADDSGRPRT